LKQIEEKSIRLGKDENLGASWNYLLWKKNRRTLKMFAPNLCVWWKMYAAFEKCLRQTFASDEKCMRPLENVRAKPLRLMKNVCGLWKMFAPNLCAWWKMYAAFGKCSRQTFAPDGKCMRPLKNGAKKEKMRINSWEKIIEQLQLPEEWKNGMKFDEYRSK
jgi:hypothetical protein